MKTVSTPKGTALPLVNLKGKDYLMVGHRLQWFNEVEQRFRIETEFLLITEEQTVARAKVTVFDTEGREVKTAMATKRETKKDFPDHTEKAETSAVGRALAMLGYGTQFALSDLDEGDRLADSPVVDTTERKVAASSTPSSAATVAATLKTVVTEAAEPKKAGSFRKAAPKKTDVAVGAESDGWE
jgi:hypothetical protein